MFYKKAGKIALGSRLRRISQMVTEDALQLYSLYDVALKPKWFPVFYCLSQTDDSKSVTSIANEIGHSHPSVVKIIREMAKSGIVTEEKDVLDGRKNNIRLTTKGHQISSKIQDQYTDVDQALENALGQTSHNLWLAIEEFEFLLEQQSLFSRVLAEKKARESSVIQIVAYTPQYASAFKQLNEEWIRTNFTIEEADAIALDNPDSYIIDKGGKIIVALYHDQPVGVCALIKMEHERYDYELAKMAVSPKMRGKGIGLLLGNAIIELSKSLRAKAIYLESNTLLKPAIALYQKLGFKKVAGLPTPYARCNIQMELKLQLT